MAKIEAFQNLNFETITANKPEYKQVEWEFIISDIDLNIRNEEKYTTDPELHELAYSIINFGLRQPIVLYKDKSKRNSYHIWHGQRRFSAIKLIHHSEVLNYFYEEEPYKITSEDKANLLRIPCVILPEPKDSTERILRQIAENEHRKDVDNLELCKQYNELLQNNPDWNQELLSEKVGKSKQIISDICGLKRIEPKIQKLIAEIQIYGSSLRKAKDVVIIEQTLFDNDMSNFKKIGIKQLRKIAASDNQAQTFWELFSSKCTKEDADFIGLNLTEKETIMEKDLFKEMNNDYLKWSKKVNSADEKDKEKYHAKKLDSARKLILHLMEENKLSSKDLEV